MEELAKAVEALLFVSGEPLDMNDIAQALETTMIEANAAVNSLQSYYEKNGRGIQLRRINGKLQLCTNSVYSKYVEKLLRPEQTKGFSQSVLETLSIVAYKQPVTRGEIEGIRGVRCEYAISQLVKLNLIVDVGRKNTVGKPVLFGTTDSFLQLFNLSTIEELPYRRHILAQAAGEGEVES